MFVFDDAAFIRHAAQKLYDSKSTGSLGEESFARITAAKVVDLAAARARLRPPEPLINSLARTLANIDAAFASSQRTPSDG